MDNKVQLICYVDRLAGGGFKDLTKLLQERFDGVFGAVHVLPFYYPINGADAGFDPIDHAQVDPRLGNWEDVTKLGEQVSIVADLIVNHMSADSDEFNDFLLHGGKSEYAELFLTKESVFPHGAREEELSNIYRPRPGLPFTTYRFFDGTEREMWTTFTSSQIDIDVHSKKGRQYLENILERFSKAGVKLIRLDAAGYALKKAGTSCFMIPETYTFISDLTQKAHDLGMEVLVEIHSYYQDQINIARKVNFVYDFALPPLILHAIYRKQGDFLMNWIQQSPRNCITVLDTHDGIGVIDVGAHSRDKLKLGLLPPAEIDFLIEEMHKRSDGTSRKATGAAASNLDLYQVNSTYYDVLGQDDSLYLLARAIQFFCPGLPQVYYVGLLGGTNDMELLASTNVGRDINRHYFTPEEIAQACDKPFTQKLLSLIKLRNQHQAFQGDFSMHEFEGNYVWSWTNGTESIKLVVDFDQLSYCILDGGHVVTL